jgi:hypothetical protein
MHQVFPPLLVKHLYDFSKNSNKKWKKINEKTK